jgi:hypothetical protein
LKRPRRSKEERKQTNQQRASRPIKRRGARRTTIEIETIPESVHFSPRSSSII